MNANQKHEWAVRILAKAVKNFEAHTGMKWNDKRQENYIAELEEVANSKEGRAIVECNLAAGRKRFNKMLDMALPQLRAMLDETDKEKN